MRIKSIDCIPVGWPVEGELRWGRMAVRRKGAPVIRVTTDEGVEGIGEAGFSIEFFRSVSVIVEGILVPALLGENPLDVERQQGPQGILAVRPGLLVFCRGMFKCWQQEEDAGRVGPTLFV